MAESAAAINVAKGKKEDVKKRFQDFELSQEEPLRASRMALEAAQNTKAQWGWVPFSDFDGEIKAAALNMLQIISGAS